MAIKKVCPKPDKEAFKTKAEADKRLRGLFRMVQQRGDGHAPIRSYRCCCKQWHLTAREDIGRSRRNTR